MTKSTLNELFAQDPKRFENFSLESCGLLFDYSKQSIDSEDFKKLVDVANESNLALRIQELFSGGIVNHTEQRSALHTQLRDPEPTKVEVTQVQNQIKEFVTVAQEQYRDVIVLGIGGSDLGPRLVCEALANYKTTTLNLHFVANVDADTLLPLLKRLNPESTLCIINSKTFTTVETLTNAKIVKNWLGNNNLVAVTANKVAAIKWGISAKNIFEFWDWVGGRFSVWSAVGLPIALNVGFDNFKRFLSGAHAMDQHFQSANFAQNMPVIMALLGIWNINYLDCKSLAIIPYMDGLQLLPSYLQQLEMESNGKAAAQSTAPIIWGGVGCNAQHAYMQMLHQGTQVVPVDFLVGTQSANSESQLQDLLFASCIGQSQALMQGKDSAQTYKVCPGNRPSSTIVFERMTPEIIGAIIALYEHKVFVQGVIWGIESFDQWGVQLGKDLIKDLLSLLQSADTSNVDSSTAGLIQHYLKKTRTL